MTTLFLRHKKGEGEKEEEKEREERASRFVQEVLDLIEKKRKGERRRGFALAAASILLWRPIRWKGGRRGKKEGGREEPTFCSLCGKGSRPSAKKGK